MTKSIFTSFIASFLLLLGTLSVQAHDVLPVEQMKPMRGIIIVIEDVPAMVEPSDDDPIVMGANPTSNSVWVNVKGITAIEEITVFDSEGDEIHQEGIGNDSFKFMLEGFDTGLYYIKFRIEDKHITKTLIVE
ncbi:MAG: T9SS type A sorting domain-containing protein [Bacteroidota bacterium]